MDLAKYYVDLAQGLNGFLNFEPLLSSIQAILNDYFPAVYLIVFVLLVVATTLALGRTTVGLKLNPTLSIGRLKFIAAGNIYYTRREELTWLFNAAQTAGICLHHSTINKSTNPRIVRICWANNCSGSRT
jgi:hypothetical protein